VLPVVAARGAVRTSEWKRHQAAPGPKVSRRAFGRERRYPISNGYREKA
jgi:NAD+ synthase (glutamine-hydrolysing)